MNRSFRAVIVIALAVTVGLSAGCRGSKNKVAAEEAREGRDRALLGEGIKEMQDGKFRNAQLLFNTLINTYPDSSLLPVTKLAIADSFYRVGDFASMNQAEREYRDWLTFFPKHQLADDVMIKIAEIHLRQVQAPDRDPTHVHLAERQIVKLLEAYPNSNDRKRAEDMLWEAREVLGMHELKVARFYYTHRQAYKATAARSKMIIDNYASFSYLDEALYLHAVSMYELEDSEEAIKHLTRLCKYYPDSKYYEDAAKRLKALDAPVPDPAPEAEQPEKREQPGRMGRIFENITRPRFDNISDDGVLFKKDDTEEVALEKALKFKADEQQDATAASPQ